MRMKTQTHTHTHTEAHTHREIHWNNARNSRKSTADAAFVDGELLRKLRQLRQLRMLSDGVVHEILLVIRTFQIDVFFVFVAVHLIGTGSEGMAHAVSARRLFQCSASDGRRSRSWWIVTFLLHPFVLGPPVLEPDLHLSFGQVERLRQLFAFGSHHVVVLLEGVFQLQQLTGTESRSHSLRLAERRQQKTCQIWTCNPNKNNKYHCPKLLTYSLFIV